MSQPNSNSSSKEVRQKILGLRRALTAEQLLTGSEAVCEKFLSRAEAEFGSSFFEGLRVGLYRALPGELILASIEGRLVQAGALLHFPKVMSRDQSRMEMIEVEPHHLSGFEVGPYGVHEPPLKSQPVDPALLDLIIIPGLAFGKQGERVGMGAGYYDRYLPLCSRALRISLVFDFQMVSALEQSPWDQSVHWILTDRNEFATHGFSQWKKVRNL